MIRAFLVVWSAPLQLVLSAVVPQALSAPSAPQPGPAPRVGLSAPAPWLLVHTGPLSPLSHMLLSSGSKPLRRSGLLPQLRQPPQDTLQLSVPTTHSCLLFGPHRSAWESH